MKRKMTIVIGIIIVALILLSLAFYGWQTARVVTEFEQPASLGDSLSGNFVITIESGDKISANSPITVSLSKDNKIIQVETLTLKEFVALSDKSYESPKDNADFYTVPESYTVDVNKIISYKFTESGNYELVFSMLQKDLIIQRKINI